MERKKEEKISDILMRFLRQNQLESPLNEYRLIQSWEEVAGSAINRNTLNLKIYNQKLFVKLRSAALRSELMMRRSELVKELNHKVGANVIVDICFS